MSAARVSRGVKQSILARETPEGVGATVRRSIGTAALRNFTPFLMLDHFEATPGAAFPDHGHRGICTVSYLLAGEFAHEDFAGNKGLLQPGDLQFMIAGRGIVHSEVPLHREGQANPNGLQLWIDLPKAHKLDEPSYQDLKADQIPSVHPSPDVHVKVICGTAEGSATEGFVSSPVRPLGGCWFFDVTLNKKGAKFWQAIPQGWNAFTYILEGDVTHGSTPTPAKTFYTTVLTSKDGETGIELTAASEKARLVVIAGEPLDQEIYQHGPFVMDTREGLIQAFRDYQAGTNGFELAKTWKSETGTAFLKSRSQRA